jgi:hypothetical protein
MKALTGHVYSAAGRRWRKERINLGFVQIGANVNIMGSFPEKIYCCMFMDDY